MAESMRFILYDAVQSSGPLRQLLTSSDGTFQFHAASALDIVPPRPFCTYRMHTGFPVGRGVGERQYVQVWANDDPGDYQRIDEILREVRIAIEAAPPKGRFLQARWIETGVDLRDDAMQTINRYIRFQFTGTLRERE